jgi:hypothetical protein
MLVRTIYTRQVSSLIHLGMSKNTPKRIFSINCVNSKKGFKTLNSIGYKPNGNNYFLIAKLYMKFCQSILFMVWKQITFVKQHSTY